MNKLLSIVTLLVLTLGFSYAATSAIPELQTCNVMHSIEAPGSVNGIAWDAGSLWVAADPYPYRDEIFKLNPNTGAVISSFFDQYSSTTGLEVVNGYVWSLRYSYSAEELVKYTKSGGMVSRTAIIPPTLPFLFDSGYTWDGAHFWVHSWNSLYKVSAQTGSTVSHMVSPVAIDSGLAWDGIDLWVSHDKLYKVNVKTGRVLFACTIIDSREEFSNAVHPRYLTWDGEYLWVSSLDHTVYKVSVPRPRNYIPPPKPDGIDMTPIIQLLLLD